MLLFALTACTSPDPSPWVGTWFGWVDWWSGDVDHFRSLSLEVSATGGRDVPAHAEGSVWAAHDEASVVCNGIIGEGAANYDRLVLVCDVDGASSPVGLALWEPDSDNPDQVVGQASEVSTGADAPPLTARNYEAWSALTDDGCAWTSPYCEVNLYHAVDGVTERSLDTSSLVDSATVDCTDDGYYPLPVFEGQVEPSVTGLLLEFAIRHGRAGRLRPRAVGRGLGGGGLRHV